MPSPKLSQTYLVEGGSNAHILSNTWMFWLECIQFGAKDRTATPPGSPAEGDLYILTGTPSGDWAARAANHLALYYNGAWLYLTPTAPLEGFVVWVNDEDVQYVWNGTAWGAISGGGSAWEILIRPQALVADGSSGFGLTVRNQHILAAFDASTDETGLFTGVLPTGYAGGGLAFEIHWTSATATSGSVIWEASIERLNTDIDADSFAGIQFVSGAAPSGAGELRVSEIPFTSGAQMDSLLAGEAFRLKVNRDANGTNGTDDMVGDAQIVVAVLKETV